MMCSRCGRPLQDDAKFCASCGQPRSASNDPPPASEHLPRFLAGYQNMMESRWWTPSFKEFLSVLRPRLVEAWGLNFTFDNGLCALLSSGRHKGGDFIEFSLFFDQGGNVLKASPQDFIRWRSVLGKWRGNPAPRLRGGDPLQSELEGILQALGCRNFITPQPAVHHLRRPDSSGGGPAWYTSINTRWNSGSLDGRALLARLDDIAGFLSRMQNEARTSVQTVAS